MSDKKPIHKTLSEDVITTVHEAIGVIRELRNLNLDLHEENKALRFELAELRNPKLIRLPWGALVAGPIVSVEVDSLGPEDGCQASVVAVRTHAGTFSSPHTGISQGVKWVAQLEDLVNGEARR